MKKILKSIITKKLEYLARAFLWRFRPTIVAITGSVGKTGTKTAVALALEGTGKKVRASEKSFNSELGVPLTIVGSDTGWNNPFHWLWIMISSFAKLIFTLNYPRYLVLEVGADHPGDIEKITSWLKPNIAIVTQMSDIPVHIEFFSSVEELVKEKSYLVRNMQPDGLAILNKDDSYSQQFADGASNRPFFVGSQAQGTDLFVSHYQINYTAEGQIKGMSVKINHNGSCVPVTINGVVGRQLIYPIMFAAAVGLNQNMNLVSIGQALQQLNPEPGRMRVLKGEKATTIIDDSYNSSPIAVTKALETVRDIETSGRKICVLGDMLELGDHSKEAHRRVGRQASSICDLLITVGKQSQEAKHSAEKDMKPGQLLHFKDSTSAGEKLSQIIELNDLILIKGSQGLRMERVVEQLMAEPEKKDSLLCRQSREWQKR